MTRKYAKLEGVKPLLKRLKLLPERSRRYAVRPAVNAAATPVLKTARIFAPVGDGKNPDGSARKHLKQALGKSGVKWERRADLMYVLVGEKAKEAPHGHLVHGGTKPHLIVLKAPVALKNGVVLPAGYVIHHPGTKPNQFLDRALEVNLTKSAGIMKTKLASGIEKQAQKLARQK